MPSNKNQLQITSELLYTPSMNLTSIIYYNILKDQENKEYISITKTEPLKGQERENPGKFSKQCFMVNEFQIDDIKSDKPLPLKNAYDINGMREEPTNINVTSGFIKAILRKIHGTNPA